MALTGSKLTDVRSGLPMFGGVSQRREHAFANTWQRLSYQPLKAQLLAVSQ
jgi:hypothetical protein